MSAYYESVPGMNVAAEHLVQLFDGPDSLGPAVGAYLADGYHRGETLLVVVSSANWIAIRRHMESLGVPVDAALDAGRINTLDAAVTVARFTSCGVPDADRFERSLGALVRRLAERAGAPGVRAYGEMVDVLASEGSYEGAVELESLWCALRERLPIELFCGYRAAHFGDPRNLRRLEQIVRLHDRVLSHEDDILGSFLTARARGQRC